MLARLFESWDQIINGAVSSGYVVALALVCLLQYVVHFYHIIQRRHKDEQFRQEVEGLENEMTGVRKDSTLTRLENSILREFVSQTDLSDSLDLLFKRFIPDTRHGFAVFLERSEENRPATYSRGLSEVSRGILRLDDDLWNRLACLRTLELDRIGLEKTCLPAGLSQLDRKKARQLFLVAVGESDKLLGALLTTSLYPTTAPREQQVELAQRLMASIAGTIRQTETVEEYRSQLNSTREMLELRSIADRQFESPLRMVEAFLARMADLIGADRVALYLSTQNTENSGKAIVRCGNRLQPGSQNRWIEHEDRLAGILSDGNELQFLNSDDLKNIGVDSLMGSAIVSPLIQKHEPMGTVCFTKSARDGFDNSHQELITWSAEFLAETILRALGQAMTVRQARQDSLTGLANRRAFDEHIESELRIAQSSGTSCSLLLCDLDRFKSINDHYGHLTGDEVLRTVSQILMQEMSKTRSTDNSIIARYGGEEMAILLPGVGLDGARRIAELLRHAIEKHVFQSKYDDFHVTMSVGIAVCPNHATTANELIAAADTALYRAKEKGRNQVCYTAELLV